MLMRKKDRFREGIITVSLLLNSLHLIVCLPDAQMMAVKHTHIHTRMLHSANSRHCPPKKLVMEAAVQAEVLEG